MGRSFVGKIMKNDKKQKHFYLWDGYQKKKIILSLLKTNDVLGILLKG